MIIAQKIITLFELRGPFGGLTKREIATALHETQDDIDTVVDAMVVVGEMEAESHLSSGPATLSPVYTLTTRIFKQD